jgi:tetraacyldisaccharide 4'-kinase
VKPPLFWNDQRGGGWRAALLMPVAGLWAGLTALRLARPPRYAPPVPVICVGNLTVGGSGKTPVVQALTGRLQARGYTPHILSRGYGGRLVGPVRVDRAQHWASDVGDEPLLHAEYAPTWVGRDRAVSARVAVAAGADILIMDDGLQNPALRQDLRLAVVDGAVGFGNGRVMPAGPLRQPVRAGLARCNAVVLLGADETAVGAGLALPVLRGRIVPEEAFRHVLGARPIMAFAGIGRPTKFYRTLTELGVNLVRTVDFDDHHPYTAQQFERLVREAKALDAMLVTTSKDGARLTAAQRQRVVELRVTVAWDDDAVLDGLLDQLPRFDAQFVLSRT